MAPHDDSGSFCIARCAARGVTPHLLAGRDGRLVLAPLRHDLADRLGLCGRDPALDVDQAAFMEALAVAVLLLGVARGHGLPYSDFCHILPNQNQNLLRGFLLTTLLLPDCGPNLLSL